jgi:hypothetical protein
MRTHQAPETLSSQLEAWLAGDHDRTVGDLVEFFGSRSFAFLFLLLLAVPALPLPTGGATHVGELIAILLALQLVAGRSELWLPRRWRNRDLVSDKRQRYIRALLRFLRFFERFSRPRLSFMFGHRLSDVVFGLLVLLGSTAAFLAPPFTGLDTLPALGVVLVSLGVLFEDFALVVAGVVAGVAGVLLAIVLGEALVRSVRDVL